MNSTAEEKMFILLKYAIDALQFRLGTVGENKRMSQLLGNSSIGSGTMVLKIETCTVICNLEVWVLN
jgi:hypothetical protein